MLGVVTLDLWAKAIGKEVLHKLGPFKSWADAQVAYERELSEDPVPSGWKEYKPSAGRQPPGHDKGPVFQAQPGRAPQGGPSAKLKLAVHGA